MEREVKSIEFFECQNELSPINLNEIRGGLSADDLSTGCSEEHHMAYTVAAFVTM